MMNIAIMNCESERSGEDSLVVIYLSLIRKFNTTGTETRHWIRYLTIYIHLPSSQHISLRSILLIN